MKEIDGSHGGGQILRRSLALAAVTETPVRVTGIRGERPEPGLKPQHLTALETLAEVTDATLDGATLGATTIEFDPGPPRGGQVTASIGTAGSVALLFDALLPLATRLSEPLSITVDGGTEVKWSPPLIVHEQVKLPLCRQFGLNTAVERHRTGFYPAGGGRATLHLFPSTLSRVAAADRGSLVAARCYSLSSADLRDSEVARRQAATARDRLDESDVPVSDVHIHVAETRSTGSALAVELEYEHTRAAFDALGEKGLPAEAVATRPVDAATSFHGSDAAVDSHLADQLLALLALGGGRLRIPELTDHVETSLDLLEQFGFDLTVETAATSSLVSADPSR